MKQWRLQAINEYFSRLLQRRYSKPSRFTDNVLVKGAADAPLHWSDLSAEQQQQLQIAYGYYLDSLPPTCSLETKNARFAAWLSERFIVYRSNK